MRRRILYGVGIFVGLLILIWIFLTKIFYLDYTVPTSGMANSIMAGDRILARPVSFANGRLPKRGSIIVFDYPGNRDEAEPPYRQVYVERCAAIAGDTLEIRNGEVYINGAEEPLPKNAQRRTTPHYSPELDALNTFPNGRRYTRDNWGPMRIPKMGDVISLNPNNIGQWYTFIVREGHVVRQDIQSIIVDDRIVNSYAVERDYIFGIGDNRNDSQDSRYWGFIPVENVIGIPSMVYFSKSPESGEIRWDRIFVDIE